MKLSEAMREKMLLSFELFPPKTEKGMANLPGTIEHLMKYRPEYISCTYGAGGGNVGANREVCQMIRNAGTVPVTHFTVIKNTKEGIRQQLEQYLADGVDHMLALRGDIPLGETTTCGDFNYATDLVKFVRDEFGDKFEIAVAGSPEGHIAEKGMANLPGTIEHLMKYRPEYISCTYGAGGGNVGANREVCQMIRNAGTVPVTHFTVIKNTKEGIRQQLEQYLADGVDHMLALRGDIPLGETTTCGDFNYATDLVKFVRDEFGDKFEIAVAGSPEGHIACRSLDADIAVLRQKQDNGADYIMTQLCWDMEQFKYWLDAIREAGVTMPVDVGVMPILDQAATINMALSRNGCVMDSELCRLISRNWLFPNPFNAKDADGKPFDMFYEDKVKRFKEEGIEYTIRQIDEYRALGVDGIHLYALNKWKDVSEIIDRSGLRTLI